VTEACFAAGYGSLGTFSARFHELVGCPPSEYRRQARLLVRVPGLWLPRPIPRASAPASAAVPPERRVGARSRSIAAPPCDPAPQEAERMIQRMSHTTIYVTDQDVAHEFYVGKLGFEVRTDATMDNGFRWLTVGPKGQPDLEIILMKVGSGPTEDESLRGDADRCSPRGARRRRVRHAGLQADLRGAARRGVQFKSPPEEKFYGVEAILEDPFGNWFSMTSETAEARAPHRGRSAVLR
jgi:catechol 2,3-dioxygenase-like lactoylglutathione lyase family enzyme